MAFLAPAFLALAVLAGVPLLVHLLRRRVGRTVDFPAVRYLARMEQEHSRELKLRHRMLLLLRILAVMAIALAAARPIARFAGVGHAPIAVAMVLDNSMSSGAVRGGRTVFDSLRAEARRLLRDLTIEDRAWLVTADGRVIGGRNDAVSDALDQLTPLAGRGDLAIATRRAIALAQSGAPRTPVVAILSDGQANALAADSTIVAGDVAVVALVQDGAAVVNRAVLAAVATPTRWTPLGEVSASISTPDSAAWRITLNSRTVARGVVGPASFASPARVMERLSSTESGWLRGSVELDADALRGDDTRWFAVRVAPPPRVAIRPESGPFLAAALATLVDEQRLARAAEGTPDVVTVASAEARGLRMPLLLTAPRDPLQVGEANRSLERLGIPWRFGAIARNLVLARPTRETALLEGPAFERTPVRLRYPLVYSPGARGAGDSTARNDTIATAGGAPWVVAGTGFVLVGSPLEPEATDLPLRAPFVPWLLDALARRLGQDGAVVFAAPGQQLATADGASALERPDGTLVPLTGERFTVPGSPGVYFFRRQAVRSGALVVNAEPEESDVGDGRGQNAAGLDPSRWVAPINGESVIGMRDASQWRRTVFEQASGQALLLPLVALALAALLLEAWLSGR